MKEKACIEVIANRLHVQIPLHSILWIDAWQNAVFLHTDDGVVKTYMTCTEIRKLLEQRTDAFLSCYKGCIVNMNRVSHTDKEDFIMDNGDRVQIRQRDGKRIRLRWDMYHRAQAALV